MFSIYGIAVGSDYWQLLAEVEGFPEREILDAISEPITTRSGYVKLVDSLFYPNQFVAFKWYYKEGN